MIYSGLSELINDRLLRHFDIRLVRRSWLEAFARRTAMNYYDLALPLAASDGMANGKQAATAARRKIRNISTIAELDEILHQVEKARLISDDAMLEAFQTFEFRPSAQELPKDPFSREYADYQFALYTVIADKDYQVKNEATNWLSVEDHSAHPFPYYTGSYQIVSDHLVMVGLIIRTLQLAPGAKILEFGAGYGNTTLALAQMGYDVTVIDIEQRFLDIIEARCARLKNPPRTICADFTAVEELHETYDAILFYECFHHCSDHQRLVSQLVPRLNPGGQIMFAAEPITDSFPMPWGLRLDGQSLWAIRNNGWLELGFTETYFKELMAKNNLTLQKHYYPITELGTIFVARPQA